MAEEAKTRADTVFVCSFSDCFKSFKKQSRLLEHFRTHTGERPYHCTEPGCTKSYARVAHLRRHLQVYHPGSDEPEKPQTFLCSTEGCAQVFTNPHNLKRHIKRVHTNKQYKCSFDGCVKTFRKHQQLKTHQFEHTNVKPYVCSVDGCGKSFCLPSKLKQHQKSHEGFVCDVDGCSVKVMKWSLMRKHKALEHVQCHKCTHCEKTFKQKSWLKCHMVVHQDSRQAFQCPRDDCARVYFDERNLAAHIRSYHDGQHFHCVVNGCDRTLCSKSKLQQHAKLHDPNRPLPKRKSRKGQRKKTIASVISGFDPKRMIGIEDPLSQVDSEVNQITPIDIKQGEVTHSLRTSTAATNNKCDPLESDDCGNKSVTSCALVDVSMETQDSLSNENGQHIESGFGCVQNGAVTDVTSSGDKLMLTNESFNEMEIKSSLLSRFPQPATKDVFSNRFDCTASAAEDGCIVLKSIPCCNNNLEKGDYSVRSGCSQSSLPIGEILGKPSVINSS